MKLHAIADMISEGLTKGDVYIHCKAGHGRSAMGELAYVIKYKVKIGESELSTKSSC